MKYKKGDKVRFLNAVGEGTVTKTTSDGTIFVLDETGFEVPANEDELILIKSDSSYKENNSVTNENTSEFNEEEFNFYPQKSNLKKNDTPNAFFALVPQQEKEITNTNLDSYLINDSNYIVFYNLISTSKHTKKGINAGIIEPNTKISLFTILKQNIAQSPNYLFQLTFYTLGEYEPVTPIEKEIIISPIKLFKENTFKENDFFHEKSLIIDLTKSEEKPVEQQKNQNKKLKELEEMLNTKKKIDIQPQNKIIKVQNEEKREIDLHINELMDNTAGLTNNDILDIQMNKFQDEMEKAIKDNLKRIIFIHGIGNGTLKNSLRKTLSKKYEKYPFHDASFKEYGFGATLIVLRN